ncbi:hypothetical protein BJX65DRAFT_33028 [Aspergillus insuetus]
MSSSLPPNREKTSRLQNQYNRLLYPFRRETLAKLMDTMTWLQSNLDTALHILEISMLNSGHHLMESVLSNTMSTALIAQELVRGLGRLENQHASSESTLTMLLQRIDQMESHIKVNSGQPITTPNLLRSLLYTQRENDEAISSLVSRLHRRRRTKNQTRRCRCDSMYAQLTVHRPWCPLQNQSRKLVSLFFRHTFCSRFLRFSATVSLNMTKGAGGFAISPSLRFRAVVLEDSPAFSLLHGYGCSRGGLRCMIGKTNIKVAHQKLFTLFNTGQASPTDTLENGDTLLHAASMWLARAKDWDNDAWADWHAFIDDMLAMGVPPGSLNELGETPADVILFSSFAAFNAENRDEVRQTHTVKSCIKLLTTGSFITGLPRSSSPADMTPIGILRAIPFTQSIVAQYGWQDMEMPTELHALISQSADELRSLLQALGPRGWTASVFFDFYAIWPEGLATLLEHGYAPTEMALYYAIITDCVSCVKLILGCEIFALDTRTLHGASGLWYNQPEIQQLIIEAFISRRFSLQVLAETRLPVAVQAELDIQPSTLLNRKASRACELLKSYCVNIAGLEQIEADCVYSAPRRGLDFWNELYDAGFRNVDEPDEYGGTALRWCCTIYDYITAQLERAEWLVSRGADLYRLCYGSPVIHDIAKRIGINMATGEHEDLSAMSEACVQLLHLILLDDYRDDCDCACCAGGCFAFKRLLESTFDFVKEAAYRIGLYGPPLSAIFHTIDKTLITTKKPEFYKILAPRLLRFLTFCELDLTHTCNHHGEEMKSDQIRDIQQEEASLIAQLSTLVDELLGEYSSSSLTLHQFLKEVWRDKMDEILSEIPDHQDAAQLRRVGLTLLPNDPGVTWSDLLDGPRAYYPPSWLFSELAL